MKPLAIDLFCGLGGWAEGLLAEGWDVIGFDIGDHPDAFGWKRPRTNSKSSARKMASAMIAKIPLPLSSYIGRVFHPSCNPGNLALR